MHFTTGISPERERRLCSFSGEGGHEAAETLQAEQTLRENSAIQEGKALYADPELRKLYPELTEDRNVDRAYMLSLLTEGMLPEGIALADVRRDELDPFDALHLLSEYGKDYEKIGEKLRKCLPLVFLQSIFGNDLGNDERLGSLYKERVLHARRNWTDKKLIAEDKALLRIPLEYYRGVREGVGTKGGIDDLLRKNEIGIPRNENESGPDMRNRGLERSEYFSLLVLCSKGYVDINSAEVITLLKTEKIEGVRKIIRSAQNIDLKVKEWVTAARSGNIDAITEDLDTPDTQNILTPTCLSKSYTDDALRPLNAALDIPGTSKIIDLRAPDWYAMREREATDPAVSSVRSAPLARSLALFVPTTIDTLGPSELLKKSGVSIGTTVVSNYIRLIGGRSPDKGKSIPVPGVEELVPSKDATAAELPRQSAETWLVHPERALPVLLACGMESTGPNEMFLHSLEFHFPPDGEKKLPPKDPVYSEENTKALLASVIQQLAEYEQPMRNTFTRGNSLREELNTGEKVEKNAREIWEYMKDIQSHPLGSAIAWIVAIGAVRKGWDILFNKESNNFIKGAFWLSLTGIAAGLYQQHKDGKAWWESIGPQIDSMFKREKKLPPEQQSMPDYWFKELALSDSHELLCLSVLGNQPTKAVLDWYDACERTGLPAFGEEDGAGSGKPKKFPDLPFTIDGQIRRRLGPGMRSQERVKLFHATLKKFLASRGAALRKQIPEYKTATSLQNDAALGADYIRERYVEQTFIRSIIRGVVAFGDIKMSADELMSLMGDAKKGEWEEKMKTVKKVQPEVYARLLIIRDEYLAETRERDTSRLEMNMVFLFEADPAILRRQGKTEAAGYRDAANRGAQDLQQTTDASAVVPEDRAKKLDILEQVDSKGEAALLKALSNGKLSVSEKFTTRDGILQDWKEFCDRLPADDGARKKLQSYMNTFLKAGNVSLETMNEVERKKYQLLIAAMGSKTLIGEQAVSALDPSSDATWNVTLDKIMDYVKFDETKFPSINGFADLQGLLGSEVNEKDTSEWYEYWKRILPSNGVNKFDQTLRPRIAAYTVAFERLRALPILAPNDDRPSVLKPAQIDAMEAQLARRMGNRFLEAMLKRHGNPVRDAVEERTVSPIEQENLVGYCDTVFTQIMGQSAEALNASVKLDSTLAKINNFIWKDGPDGAKRLVTQGGQILKEYVWDDTKKYWVETGGPWIADTLSPITEKFSNWVINVSNKGGKWFVEVANSTGEKIGKFVWESYESAVAQLYKWHGVPKENFKNYVENEQFIQNYKHNEKSVGLRVSILDTRDVQIGQNDINPYLGTGFVLTVPIAEFAKADLAQVKEWIKQWRNLAVSTKKEDIEKNTSLHLQYTPGDEWVEFGDKDSKQKGKSSVYEFVSYPNEKIVDAYKAWISYGEAEGSDPLLYIGKTTKFTGTSGTVEP